MLISPCNAGQDSKMALFKTFTTRGIGMKTEYALTVSSHCKETYDSLVATLHASKCREES